MPKVNEVKAGLAYPCMFFAGLILLIPHRIGMSRVNYVIKRYNLPISRAGLLLYKYHNNIELSLLLGTLFGNIIVWYGGGLFGGPTRDNQWPKSTIGIFMIVFLILMFLSSIFMFIVYVSGSDYGHLNLFYFTLILITLFDGFTNAFAFGLNAKEGASLLSAGIPISGLLITLLHNIYKLFSDSFHLDDFDYYVLLLQLFLNVITLLITIILWSWDYTYKKKAGSTAQVKVGKIQELFSTHIYDWVPIGMLAISLGTVYAFYPSIAPYSIIDFQYTSIIELWILIISALLPLVIAVLDTIDEKYGPSGKTEDVTLISTSNKITVPPTNKLVNFSGQLKLTDIQIKHQKESTQGENDKYHPTNSTCSQGSGTGKDPSANWHPWKTHGENTHTYTIVASDDKYKNSQGTEKTISTTYAKTGFDISGTNKPSSITYTYYLNWFLTYRHSANTTITINAGDTGNGLTPANVKWTLSGGSSTDLVWWNCVWFSAIFYILCIQIFMSLLHYPQCLLSCFFNNHPFRIQFISVLFNTLRELMQACGFAGAGKQCTNLNNTSGKNLNFFKSQVVIKNASPGNNQLLLTSIKSTGNITGSGTGKDPTDIQATVHNLPLPGYSATLPLGDYTTINGSIAATNKLITLFVMMFCVFTGDGYLQHYRRCCRDNWPTTGYNKYQSFFYWLRYGFKGGIKSITSSFTDLYYHNLRPQFISYA